MKKTLIACIMPLSVLGMHAQQLDSTIVHSLQEVQVTATRAQQTTPMSFTQMTKADIEQANHGKDMPQLLQMQPSVVSSSDTGMGIGYTGLHIRGTDPTRINVTTNGVPVNDSESSQLYWVNMGDLASSLQSIQIQRGVGTSTNGAGAFGASINMQTADIGLKPTFNVDLAAGSYGTMKATTQFSSGLLGNHWGLQGRLSAIHSDGYISRAQSDLYSYFLQAAYFGENTMLKLLTFGGHEKTYMAWDYASKADMQQYGRRYNPSGIYTDSNGNTRFYDNQTDNYTQLHNQLHLTQQLGSDWKLTATLHYTYGNGYYEQFKENQKLYKYHLADPSGASRSNLVRQKKMLNHFYGGVASLNYNDRNRVQLTLGGAANQYQGKHFGNVKWAEVLPNQRFPQLHYYDNDARKTDANIYGRINYRLTGGLHAYLDLQYRYVDYTMKGTSQEFDGNNQLPLTLDRHYNFFNPKAGLTYTAGQHTIFASYAIAHKEPTRNDFEDMMAETDPVDPKAERLNDLEVGYTYQTDRFSASANLYYMAYDNQFVLTGAQDSNGEMVARNIKDSYRTGVELALWWQITKQLQWDGNATWSHNRAKHMMLTVINDDWSQQYVDAGTTPLAFSPDWIASSTLKYELSQWQISLQTKYVSKQYMTNSGFRRYLNTDGQSYTSAMIDAFCTTDIDLNYTFRLKGIGRCKAGLTVYNVLNHTYESNGSCSMNYRLTANGLEAYDGGWAWSTYSAQAPTHFMCYLNISL